MKNVYEVLRQKELELTRLEKEVEALRVAAPLLSEEKEQASEGAQTDTHSQHPPTTNSHSGASRRSDRNPTRPRGRMGRCRQALALKTQ